MNPKAEEQESSMNAEAIEIQGDGDQPILFATATCPNCRIASSYLDKAGFKYRKILAEESPEIAAALGIKQAPTLVLSNNIKIAGAGAIRRFAEKRE